MTVIVPHRTTKEKAMAQVDKAAGELFDFGSKSIEIADRRQVWTGSKMDFSFSAKVGFISLPVSGGVGVDDVNVTIQVELPALAKNFIGEEKIKGTIEQKLRGILIAS